MFALKGHIVCQVNDAANSLLKDESCWFKSDLCGKFFKPEPLLFMISLLSFPKQHEKRVSQPKVYKQTHKHTHSDSNCHDHLMQELDQRSRDQMWSVPHDSSRASVIPDFFHISRGKDPALCFHTHTSKHSFHVCFE